MGEGMSTSFGGGNREDLRDLRRGGFGYKPNGVDYAYQSQVLPASDAPGLSSETYWSAAGRGFAPNVGVPPLMPGGSGIPTGGLYGGGCSVGNYSGPVSPSLLHGAGDAGPGPPQQRPYAMAAGSHGMPSNFGDSSYSLPGRQSFGTLAPSLGGAGGSGVDSHWLPVEYPAPPAPPPSAPYTGLSGVSSYGSGLSSAVSPGTRSRLPLYEQRVAPAPTSSLNASMCPTAGMVRQETIIIWDWDDTLMCSSAINANQFMAHQAQQLERLLEQVLTLSMRLGDTCVVTNADEQWVYESTRRFAPRVMPILSQIPILSARRKWEHACPGDVFAWKRETFKEVLLPRANVGLNLVVLGDSPAEMEAAQTATMALPCHPLIIKTIKFKESPSCEEILEQLRTVVQELSTYVADERSGRRELGGSAWPQGPSQQLLSSTLSPATYMSATPPPPSPGAGVSYSGTPGTLMGSRAVLRVV